MEAELLKQFFDFGPSGYNGLIRLDILLLGFLSENRTGIQEENHSGKNKSLHGCTSF